MPTFTVAGESFELERADIEATCAEELPDPIQEHYVVVGGRRYPPKQVLACATALDRADFTTHQARRILRRLGFVAARASATAQDPSGEAGTGRSEQAAALTPFVGKWVALAAPTEVLVAADTPQEVLAWLTRHEQRASYGMFRVPSTAPEAEGVAPA